MDIISHPTLYIFGFQTMLADPYQGFITPSSYPSRNFDIITIYSIAIMYIPIR